MYNPQKTHMDTQNDGLWFGKGGSGFKLWPLFGIYVESLGVYVYPTYGVKNQPLRLQLTSPDPNILLKG